jgi:hypothetical protein
MLASITPLGERGRRGHWPITVSAFLVGAIGAGAGIGALLGALGAIVLPDSFGTQARLLVLAIALLAALVLDARRTAVPGPRRQVNESWLDEYRGWVYGLGFGAQLGLGITTVVSSAATYVALIAALLSGSAGRGALIMGCYGAVRGAQPLAAAGVRSQRQLMSFHRRLNRWRGPVASFALGSLAAVLAAAIAGGVT